MTTKLSFSELLERAKTEKFAIHVSTKKRAITLLTELDKRGYVWASEAKLTTRTLYECYKENTCYSFYDFYGKLLDKKVMCRSLKLYQEEGYTVIEFSDIDFTEIVDEKLYKDQYGNCYKVIKGRYFTISLEEYNQHLKDMWEDK